MNAARSTGKSLLRDAATLMLVARNKKIQNHFDYRILLLERVTSSTFMPSTYVFPGGVIEQADFSSDWMDLFKESFVKFGRDFSSLVNIQGVRPPALKKSVTAVPSEVAFRICAIRETFEESGVLLLRSLSQNLRSNLSANDIHSWRQEVHSDASKFVAMCKELDCVPDVWSLSEWSNWLTPPHLKTRFDTLFFICFVDEEPTVHLNEQEVTQSKWLAPAEGVVKHVTRQMKLGMPQVYEMLRFCRFPKWRDLKSFQEGRASDGCEQWLPIIVKCSDGQLSVLPLDDLYPVLYDRTVQEMSASDAGQIATIEYPESVAEMNSKAQNLHRFSWKPNSLLCNVKLRCGQCSPVTDVQSIMNLVQETQSSL